MTNQSQKAQLEYLESSNQTTNFLRFDRLEGENLPNNKKPHSNYDIL